MEIQEYIEKNKYVQKAILDYLACIDNSEEYFQKLFDFFKDQNIQKDRNELKIILHLVAKISNNHHRYPHFFKKIEEIIIIVKESILNFYSNYEIFNIFKSNKRILLFLFKENILKPDPSIGYTIMNHKYQRANYPSFFFPEFRPFFEVNFQCIIEQSKEEFMAKNDQLINSNHDLFENNRFIGQNDNYICKLIQNDSVQEFVTFTNQNQIQLTSKIGQSIFETNSFLINKDTTLIEYAAFFGSINIFNFLLANNVALTESLWYYSVHSQNPEFLRLLSKNKCQTSEDTYMKCMIESIKCHHINISDFIKFEIFQNKQIENQFLHQIIKYVNFRFFPNDLTTNINIFYNLCQYDYFILVKYLVDVLNIDINTKKIQFKNFNSVSK